tara:strand:- start:13 stop:423 length:411 start_codon:yes stop_codon:yes gene_type:complete
MEESFKIKEVKRKLKLNKDKFKYDLLQMCNIFNVESDEVLDRFDELSDEMIKEQIQLNDVEKKINEINYGFEQLKVDFITKNNIDIRDKVMSNANGNQLLDQLWKGGFLSNDMFGVIKDELWRKRKRKDYELPKWM